MLITIIRTLIMYVFVVLTLRMMGKRQIGELEASELVVTIIISDIASIPITNTEVPILSSIMAILILMILEVVLSYIAYRNPRARSVIYGRPSTFFKNGKFDQREMERQRFNVADVMEELRGNGTCNLSDVEYIVMETNGEVSVILKPENSPITPKQMNMKCEPVRMSYIVVDNGNPVRECMEHLGLNDEWLEKQIKENGLKRVSEIFYLSFEQGSGNTVLIPKDKGKKK